MSSDISVIAIVCVEWVASSRACCLRRRARGFHSFRYIRVVKSTNIPTTMTYSAIRYGLRQLSLGALTSPPSKGTPAPARGTSVGIGVGVIGIGEGDVSIGFSKDHVCHTPVVSSVAQIIQGDSRHPCEHVQSADSPVAERNSALTLQACWELGNAWDATEGSARVEVVVLNDGIADVDAFKGTAAVAMASKDKAMILMAAAVIGLLEG